MLPMSGFHSYGRTILHCVYVPYFYPVIYWWTIESFLIFAIVKYAVLNKEVWVSDITALWYIPWGDIAELYDRALFCCCFSRTVLHKGCTNCIAIKIVYTVPFLYILIMISYFVLLVLVILTGEDTLLWFWVALPWWLVISAFFLNSFYFLKIQFHRFTDLSFNHPHSPSPHSMLSW